MLSTSLAGHLATCCTALLLLLLRRHAAQALDAGADSATMSAAMAKRFATDACFGIANDALQVTPALFCLPGAQCS